MCDHGIRKVEKQDFDAALIDRIGDSYATADVVDGSTVLHLNAHHDVTIDGIATPSSLAGSITIF